ADVDAARPIGRDFERRARLPFAFAQAMLAYRRCGLRLTLERPDPAHEAPAVPAVITEAEQVDRERRRRIGADEELDLLARPHRLAAGETLDQRRAPLRLRV